jgi:hemoglobin-like flavoprotein
MDIDEETIATFNNSLERCQTNPQFLSQFYQKFIISNTEIREKFSNTDMEQQKMMLHASIYMIMLATQKNKSASIYLNNISKRHSKMDLDIRPELYDFWLDALIETVTKIDPMYKKETETAWRTVMTFGIDYMKSKYNDTSD